MKRPDVVKRNVENTANLTDQVFGRLTAKKQVGTDNNGAAWYCVCSCGGDKIVSAGNLLAKRKPTQSCGCIQKEQAAAHMKEVGKKPNRLKDLSGEDFERWHVEEMVGTNKSGAVYRCKCKCGTIKEVGGRFLREGRSTSCGCLQKELAAKLNKGSS